MKKFILSLLFLSGAFISCMEVELHVINEQKNLLATLPNEICCMILYAAIEGNENLIEARKTAYHCSLIDKKFTELLKQEKIIVTKLLQTKFKEQNFSIKSNTSWYSLSNISTKFSQFCKSLEKTPENETLPKRLTWQR